MGEAQSESLDLESISIDTRSEPGERSAAKIKLKALFNSIRVCLRLINLTKPKIQESKQGLVTFTKKSKHNYEKKSQVTDSKSYINPTMFFYYESDDYRSLLNIRLTNRYGVKVLSDFAIKSRDVIALFFSSIRCERCNQLVPILKDIYERARMVKKRFEIFSISYDATREEMMNWFKMNHIGWYGIEPDDLMVGGLRYAYQIVAVPNIIVIDHKGNTLSRYGVDEVLQSGLNVLVTWF